MRWKCVLPVIGLILLTGPAGESAGTIPPEFHDLAVELSTTLTTFRNTIAASWDGRPGPTAFSANLLTANSGRGAELLVPGVLDSVRIELDGLKATGVTAVSLDIAFPVLYPPFHQTPEERQQYLDFYTQVAQEVRARGLTLIVESQALFSEGGYSYWDMAPFYAGLTLEEYQQGRMEVIRTIADTVRPDYLSVIQEPDTEADQTGKLELGTPEGSAALLDAILAGLQAAPVQGVAVGAGLGTWQTDYQTFVHNFASRDIDFVDMHIYPANRDYLPRALEIADIARSYGKDVGMTETWLYKVREPELDVLDFPAIFGRDVFSFWAPLDALHLRAMIELAHFKRFAFMSPFWSGYFRGYLTYDDSTKDLPPAELDARAQALQLENILEGVYSMSAYAYKGFIQLPRDVTPPQPAPDLSAVATGAMTAFLTWSAAPDDTGTAFYVVLRDGVFLDRTALTYFSDSGLSDGREYKYTVLAFDLTGNRSIATTRVAVPDITPPTTPPVLSVTAPLTGCQVDIQLSWLPSTDNVGVTGYLVSRGTSPAELSPIGIVSATSHSLSNIAPLTTWYFAVSAHDAIMNQSPPTNPVSVTTPAIPDLAPPTATLGYPTEGLTISGTRDLVASLYDTRGCTFDTPSGPAAVQFQIDGVNAGAEQTVPSSQTDAYALYRLSFDTRTIADGTHVLTARGRDNAGNVTTSPPVTFTVDNE